MALDPEQVRQPGQRGCQRGQDGRSLGPQRRGLRSEEHRVGHHPDDQPALVDDELSRAGLAGGGERGAEVLDLRVGVAERGAERGLDGARMAIAGDSVGGNMSAALTLLAKERGGPRFVAQVLFYPVTDASFDTGSYHQFAEGYFLRRDAMQWFWDQYTTDPAQRAEITASPLRASLDDLAGLPQALVIVAEADVLRDEGEAYAAKLRAAGVPVTTVRYAGIVHDFVGLNPLRHTYAAEAAINQGIAFLRGVLGTD